MRISPSLWWDRPGQDLLKSFAGPLPNDQQNDLLKTEIMSFDSSFFFEKVWHNTKKGFGSFMDSCIYII